MQAVILTGGRGTRLRPLTSQMPKAMVAASGKPFLLHLLELLRSQGFNDIVLCTGYLGEQVRNFFDNGESLGIRIRYSEEKGRLLGTGGALKQAQDLLDEHFFVINGDTYLPINYEEVEGAFFKRSNRAVMVVYDNQEDTTTKNNVALDNDLMVIGYSNGSSEPGLKYVDAGVLVLKREALDPREQECPISLAEGLYPFLIQQRELAAYVTEHRFYDIGTPEQLRLFEEYLARGRK